MNKKHWEFEINGKENDELSHVNEEAAENEASEGLEDALEEAAEKLEELKEAVEDITEELEDAIEDLEEEVENPVVTPEAYEGALRNNGQEVFRNGAWVSNR